MLTQPVCSKVGVSRMVPEDNMASVTSVPAYSVQQQTRLRIEPKPVDLVSTSDFSAGESTSELLEVDNPPLVLISSRVKSSGALSGCVNTGVVVVRYTYESTTLAKLLRFVGSKLKGRHALSIAFLMHGSPDCLKICSQKVSRQTCYTVCSQVHVQHVIVTHFARLSQWLH